MNLRVQTKRQRFSVTPRRYPWRRSSWKEDLRICELILTVITADLPGIFAEVIRSDSDVSIHHLRKQTRLLVFFFHYYPRLWKEGGGQFSVAFIIVHSALACCLFSLTGL